MAEIWGAALVVAGTVYEGEQQKGAARDASRAQRDAANQSIQASEQNYQRTADNLNPFIGAGTTALSQMRALNSGDFSSFKQSPDYQFTLDQSLQGLDRDAAARGSLFSGGHSADVLKLAGGLASQNYGNFYDRLAGLAQGGQNAASNLGSVGTGNAAAIGGFLTNSGNAAANGYINNANVQSNTIGQLAGLAGNYFGNRLSPTASSYSLGGNGAQPYQSINSGTLSNGTFDFARAA